MVLKPDFQLALSEELLKYADDRSNNVYQHFKMHILLLGSYPVNILMTDKCEKLYLYKNYRPVCTGKRLETSHTPINRRLVR